jgi:hypothetical protein
MPTMKPKQIAQALLGGLAALAAGRGVFELCLRLTGGGHGNYGFVIVFFPAAMLRAVFEGSIMRIDYWLAPLQWLVYALLMTFWGKKAIKFLVPFHVILIVLILMLDTQRNFPIW